MQAPTLPRKSAKTGSKNNRLGDGTLEFISEAKQLILEAMRKWMLASVHVMDELASVGFQAPRRLRHYCTVEHCHGFERPNLVVIGVEQCCTVTALDRDRGAELLPRNVEWNLVLRLRSSLCHVGS